MKELVDHWLNTFEWHWVEERINAYPNFVASIDGVNIHFLHIKGRGKNTIPMIITHGWPGSFLEMMNVIPLLTAGEPFSFDLVIPSLPGYAFSQKPEEEGMNASRIALLWARLMKELGYEKYMVQGGDFGAEVSTHLALQQPEHVMGLHLNYIPFSYRPFLKPGEELTSEEKSAAEKTQKFFQRVGAYAQQHMTQPLTLSYGLTDSPVGLAAWILQIFKNFSDPSKDLEAMFAKDELLANITLYWGTRTIHSSIRLYGEVMKDPLALNEGQRIEVPVGIAHYPFPDSFPARKFVERGYNVRYWKDMPAGGHFAAMEQPELFARDIREFTAVLVRG
jgi:pimeloyl-ACP methyl ester carboxylesterase